MCFDKLSPFDMLRTIGRFDRLSTSGCGPSQRFDKLSANGCRRHAATQHIAQRAPSSRTNLTRVISDGAPSRFGGPQ